MKHSYPAPMDRSRLVFGALACWVLFALVALAVQRGWSMALDRQGLLLWRRSVTLDPFGPAWLTGLFVALTETGSGIGRRVAAGFAALLLVRKGKPAAALPLLAITLTDGLVSNALKDLFARSRPTVPPHIVAAGGYSFPSGHSFGAAATFTAVALALRAGRVARIMRKPSRWRRR